MDSVSLVEVECACDRWQLLSSLLFCGYCSHLRCEGCAQLDVDAYACPNCFATFSPLNALQNALLCTRCMCCPFCFSALALYESNEGFIYRCSYCRWNSSEIGMQTESVKELMSLLLSRQDELVEDAQNLVAERIKALRISMKSTSSNAALMRLKTNISDRFGSGLTDGHSSSNKDELPPSIHQLENALEEKHRLAKLPTPVRLLNEDVDPSSALLRHVWSGRLDSRLVATSEQRKMHFQSSQLISGLLPHRMSLIPRLSLRCAECRKLIVKPGMQPRTADYQKRSIARDVLPTVRVVSCERRDRVLLGFSNPQQCDVVLRIRKGELRAHANDVNRRQLVQVVLEGEHAIVLSAFDPVLEHRTSRVANFALSADDDETVVAYRGANEVGIFFHLAHSDAENVTFVFHMKIESLDLDEGVITKGTSSANVRVHLQ